MGLHSPRNSLIVIDQRSMPGNTAAGRECGTCTACCTVLAVAELHKPMRWTCDHVNCACCGIYESRPQSCRDFNCAWLRGDIPGDESQRPDRLGLLFDFFQSTVTGRSRFVVFELWNGAFDEAPAAALLGKMAAGRQLDLSYRNGTWRTIGTACQVADHA
jgi:hypothetical protein